MGIYRGKHPACTEREAVTGDDSARDANELANMRLHAAIAGEYDERQALFHDAVTTRVDGFAMPFLKERSGRFLDAGCGTGFASRLGAEGGFSLFGFDIAPEMIERARTKFPAGEYIAASVFDLPYEAASFDAVAISGMLHHIADWQIALAACAALVRPDGVLLVLNEPDTRRYAALGFFRRFTSVLIPEHRVAGREKEGALPCGTERDAEYHLYHDSDLTPAAVRKLLDTAGFDIAGEMSTNVNIIANIGERAGFDFHRKSPLVATVAERLPGVEFNIAAVRRLT